MESNYEGLFFKEKCGKWEPTYVVYKKLPNGNYLVRYAEKYNDFLTSRVSGPDNCGELEYGEKEMDLFHLGFIEYWGSTERNACARVEKRRRYEDEYKQTLIDQGRSPDEYPLKSVHPKTDKKESHHVPI